MGCACKKRVNPKYVDETNGAEGNKKRVGVIERLSVAILQLCFGLFASVIIIIGLIPLLLVIIYSICTGKQMNVRVPNLQKFLKRK